MARSPEPRRWAARKGWYARVRGRRLRLASFTEGKAVAWDRLRAMLDSEPGSAATVLDVFTAHFRRQRQRVQDGELTAKSFRIASHLIGDFPERFGSLAPADLKPIHLREWLAEHADHWNTTTRSDAAAAIRAAFRSAVADGLIDRDPFAGFKRPARKAKRDSILSADEIARVREAIAYDAFRDLFDFLRLTGCRPDEARRMTAADLSFEDGVVVLAAHKTAAKTGKPRVIYPPPEAWEILRRSAAQYPDGPIFRNSRSNPWTGKQIYNAFRRAARRVGIAGSPYHLRHNFATEGLARGVSGALMGELLGHSSPQTIGKYTHLSRHAGTLKEVAARLAAGSVGPLESP